MRECHSFELAGGGCGYEGVGHWGFRACLQVSSNTHFHILNNIIQFFHTFFSLTHVSKTLKQYYSNAFTKQALNVVEWRFIVFCVLPNARGSEESWIEWPYIRIILTRIFTILVCLVTNYKLVFSLNYLLFVGPKLFFCFCFISKII